MAIIVRKSADRGRFRNHWLDSRHSFSFGEYYDERAMGFSDLRVLNQDLVSPGFGFPMHRHRDMEIVSWVLSGRLKHEDSMGHVSVVGRGGVQRLTAGSGMRHGEWCASDEEPVHFLQIWILPREAGVEPGYEGKEFPDEDLRAGWQVIASPLPEAGATRIDADARVLVTRLDQGAQRRFEIPAGRRAWIHLALGEGSLNGLPLSAGDGAALEGEKSLEIRASQASEWVLFDLR
jgi:hypothetical protein